MGGESTTSKRTGSLTGFAKAFYDAYEDLAKPQGYKIIAKVLNYPNGMIGDIGLYVSWKD
jgi:hypothetical protein